MSVPKIVKLQGIGIDDVIAGIMRGGSGTYVIELDEGTITMWGRLERVRDDPRILEIIAQLEQQGIVVETEHPEGQMQKANSKVRKKRRSKQAKSSGKH